MKKWSYDSETLAMAYNHHITRYMCCDKKFIFLGAFKTRQVNTVSGLTQGLILEEEDCSIIEDGKYEVPIILF